MKARTIAAALLLVATGWAATATAQVGYSGYALTLGLAVEAATAAVKACEAKGWPVTATVVDASGLVKATLKADHATVHTPDTAFRKAYTVATLGPIFKFDRSSAFAEIVAKYPGGAGTSLTTIPNVIALAGGVAVMHGNEIVAAIGVGGAPGGDKDEACASAGLAAIADRAHTH